MSTENSAGSIEKEPHIDPIVQETLGDYYKPEKILAQTVEQISEGEYKITFVFPPYERTIEPMDHVSMLQMHEAVLEGLFCSIGQAIKNGGFETPIDYEQFQGYKENAIYFRENFSFRKMLKPNEPANLTFKIVKVEEKKLGKAFYSVTVKIDGFMRGEVECLLEKPE